MPARLAPDACPLVTSRTQPVTAAAVAASQRIPGRRCLVKRDSTPANTGAAPMVTTVPMATPVRAVAAQRSATQCQDEQQQAAPDDAYRTYCERPGTGRRERACGTSGAPQSGGEQNARGPAKGPGEVTQRCS